MKRFFGKKWFGIPTGIVVGILLLCLLAGSAFAAVLITAVPQTVTQTITTEYGTIIAPNITDMPSVPAGTAFSKATAGTVTVDLGLSGKGETFIMVLTDPSPAYSAYSVTLTLASKPTSSNLVVGTTALTVSIGSLTGSVVLDEMGTYTFTESISGTAGIAASPATTTVTYTLEETTPTP